MSYPRCYCNIRIKESVDVNFRHGWACRMLLVITTVLSQVQATAGAASAHVVETITSSNDIGQSKLPTFDEILYHVEWVGYEWTNYHPMAPRKQIRFRSGIQGDGWRISAIPQQVWWLLCPQRVDRSESLPMPMAIFWIMALYTTCFTNTEIYMNDLGFK